MTATVIELRNNPIAQAKKIADDEVRAFNLEWMLDDMIDDLPPRPEGSVGIYYSLLSELADTYQNLYLQYRGMVVSET